MWATVLICIAIFALAALAVWGIVRRRKKKRGKCEGCTYRGCDRCNKQ